MPKKPGIRISQKAFSVRYHSPASFTGGCNFIFERVEIHCQHHLPHVVTVDNRDAGKTDFVKLVLYIILEAMKFILSILCVVFLIVVQEVVSNIVYWEDFVV